MIVILGSFTSFAHAEEISGDGFILSIVPILVALETVAIKHQNRKSDIMFSILLVKTKLLMKVPDLASANDLVVKQVRHLVLEIPLKVLALQRLAEAEPVLDVSKVSDIVLHRGSSCSKPVKVIVLVIVHPDGCYTLVIVVRKFYLGRPFVRAEIN